MEKDNKQMKDNKIPLVNLDYMQQIGHVITYSNWCIKKHMVNTGATYIYKGNSLCTNCFIKASKNSSPIHK